MNKELPSSNQYLSDRKRHIATLREIARDGTIEVGQFKGALQWAISRLDGMPEHWTATPDETSGAPQVRAALVEIRDLPEPGYDSSNARIMRQIAAKALSSSEEPSGE